MTSTALDSLQALAEVPLKSRGGALTVSVVENTLTTAADQTATGTAAAVLTTGDISGVRAVAVVISGLATETITISGLIGVGSNIASALGVETAAGVKQAATALANGTYYLRDLVARKLVFTKSSTVDNVTVTLLTKFY